MLWCIAGCIAVPIKAPPGEKPFHDEFMSFVVIGKTTRDEIKERFSAYNVNPTLMRFEDDAVWVYSASRDTWQWFVCAGGGYTADCDVLGDVRVHFLIFEFNETGRVINWQTSSTLGECAGDVCTESNAIMVYADAERDERAKRDRAIDHCRIYIYSTLPSQARDDVVSAWIDDRFVGAFVDDDGYIFELLEPGTHHITTNQSRGTYLDAHWGRYRRTISFECLAGQRYFAHHNGKSRDRGSRRFVLELEEDARDSIAKRRRILRPNTRMTLARMGGLPEDTVSRREMEEVVWQMQLRLKELGYYQGNIDGELTPETETAILEFKRQNELYGSTVLDEDTLDALGIED